MKRVAIVVALLAVVAVTAFAPATAAGKLSMWRLKTYIPPADKILDTNAQECAKKAGVELAIQTYTFDDMWTKYTAAIESRTLPDIAELDAVGPARLANLGRLTDVSDVVTAVTKELGGILPKRRGRGEVRRQVPRRSSLRDPARPLLSQGHPREDRGGAA